MTVRKRSVIVKQLPSSPELEQKLVFLQEVQATLPDRRPCLVLDCSMLRDLDEATIHLMLHCLEEALRRNGDAKVAALPAGAEQAFAAAGLGRLFDVYDTAGEAVASYHPAMTAPLAAPVQAADAA